MAVQVLVGDCLVTMPNLGAESVDSVVTDPPYGLSFMGKGWDHGVPGVEFWTAALRVLKPGGTVLDPFMGSGSTLIAASREGFNAVGIELDPEYAEIARRRITGDCPLFVEVAVA